MAAPRREFGLAPDATVGGSSYDDLVAGAIPDASEFWPPTGGTLDENVNQLNRDTEARGRRARTAPSPFRAEPVMTIPINCYPSLAGKVLARTMGGGDTVTTTSGVSTHVLAALQQGGSTLPAFHAQLVRDDLNQKMSGAQFQRASFAFPFDGYGTIETELWGLYASHFPDPAPTTDFAGLSEEPMLIRDAQAFLDGSPTAIPDLQAVEFSWVNNLARKHYAKRNVVTQVIGTPPRTRKVWWPEENRIGAAQDVNWVLQFGKTETAQELAMVYAQIEKIVIEVAGPPIPSTAAVEILRFTIYAGIPTGGGADALSARDDMTSRYEGGAFYSESDGADVLIEYVNGDPTPIT